MALCIINNEPPIKESHEIHHHDNDELLLQRAIRESSDANNDDANRLKSDEEFERELQMAIRESAKAISTSQFDYSNSSSIGANTNANYNTALIDLCNDESHDEEEKDDVKPPANRDADSNREKDELETAIQLSIETASTAPLMPKYKTLNRIEFADVVHEYVQLYGGIRAIETSRTVKDGNSNGLKRRGQRKSNTAAGGGRHQTGAQFGSFSVGNMYRIYDVLEGRDDVRPDEPEADLHLIPDWVMEELGFVRDVSFGKFVIRTNDDNDNCISSSPSRQLQGPAASKIRAFVDIGHGFGIQVLQAGWSLGVPSRGIELMADRHNIAAQIRDGVIDRYRDDPPDGTAVELKLADFTRAMIPDTVETDESEDDTTNQLRSFLLFEDKNWEIRRGLVIFVNNAENVFGPRSNQKKDGLFLDHYVARLFANMEIGGRMVTLTDVSCCLNGGNDDWYTRDVFLSGLGAVSWSSWAKSSICVYVLTKISNVWKCRFCEETSAVVTDDGRVCHRCVWCDRETKNSTRNKRRKRC